MGRACGAVRVLIGAPQRPQNSLLGCNGAAHLPQRVISTWSLDSRLQRCKFLFEFLNRLHHHETALRLLIALNENLINPGQR